MMPREKFKSITVNEIVYKRLDLSSSKVHYLLKLSLDDSKKLRRLAAKITLVPETVRVYTNPMMKKKRGE